MEIGQLEGKEIPTLENINNAIILDEIQKAVTCLKNEKAPGFDGITSEMLKCTNAINLSKIEQFFNNVFDPGYYPDAWNNGLIYSIYKSGEKYNLSNYRGITLSNSLGKLFNIMPYKRLPEKVEQNEMATNSQCKFQKNYITSDLYPFQYNKKDTSKAEIIYTPTFLSSKKQTNQFEGRT